MNDVLRVGKSFLFACFGNNEETERQDVYRNWEGVSVFCFQKKKKIFTVMFVLKE